MIDSIRTRLSEISEESVNELKKYLEILSEGGDFRFKLTDDEKKRISAAYYVCAIALTKHTESLAKLAEAANAQIKVALLACDERKMAELVALFETISRSISAHERFLSDSERTISSRSDDISQETLRNCAVSLARELSSIGK